MKEFNLNILMTNSMYIERLSSKGFNALFDYFIETNIDLNNVNIDDIIINGLNFMSIEEFAENYPTAEKQEEINVLYADKEEVAVWNTKIRRRLG